MVGAPLRDLIAEVVGRASHARSRATPTPSRSARQAHEDMRARRTTGKVVLDPRLDGQPA